MLIVIALILFLPVVNLSKSKSLVNILQIEDVEQLSYFIIDSAIDYVEAYHNIYVDLYTVNGKLSEPENYYTTVCDVYESMINEEAPPDIVLDLTTKGVISDATKAFAAELALPTISLSYGDREDLLPWWNEKNQHYLVHIPRPTDIISNIVREIADHQNYTSAVLIVDRHFVVTHKYKTLLSNLPIKQLFVEFNAENPVDQLMCLQRAEIKNFFVLASLKNISVILNAANSIKMFTNQTTWHAITHEIGDLTCNCKDVSVSFAYPIPNSIYTTHFKSIIDYYDLTHYPAIEIGFYMELLIKLFVTAANIKNQTNNEFIRCHEFNGTNTPTRNLDLNRILTEEYHKYPIYTLMNISNTALNIFDFEMNVSRIDFHHGFLVNSTYLGTWKSVSRTLDVENPQAFTKLLPRGYYRIVAVQRKPFVFYNASAPKKYSGYLVDVIEVMATYFYHWDYDIYLAFDGEVGDQDENGDWNGMMRELMLGKADIALGCMSVTEVRSRYVDFTVPVYEMSGHSILMKSSTTKSSIFRVITIFDKTIWFVIILFYLLTSLLLWLFHRITELIINYTIGDSRKFTLSECLWFCIISFTPQGTGHPPRLLSARLLIAFWWLFIFIVFATYTANLSAFITVSRLETPINSIDDLSNQYKIQYAPLNGSTTMKYFKNMAAIEQKLYQKWLALNVYENMSDYERAKLAVWEYPLSNKFTKLWNNMKRFGLPKSNAEAIKRVKSSKSIYEGFAFLTETTDAKYFAMTNCDLQLVGEEFAKTAFAMAVQKNSYLKDSLSSGILDLNNFRILELLKHIHFDQNVETVNCPFPSTSNSITFENMGIIFVFLFMGLIVLHLVKLTKYIIYKIKNN